MSTKPTPNQFGFDGFPSLAFHLVGVSFSYSVFVAITQGERGAFDSFLVFALSQVWPCHGLWSLGFFQVHARIIWGKATTTVQTEHNTTCHITPRRPPTLHPPTLSVISPLSSNPFQVERPRYTYTDSQGKLTIMLKWYHIQSKASLKFQLGWIISFDL